MTERDAQGTDASAEMGENIRTEETAQEGAGDAEGSALQEKEAELKAAQDRYVRLAAEFDNYRKRMVREKEESRKYALEGFIRDLLPVVDNLERALKHASETGNTGSAGEGNTAGLVSGVEMVLKQFRSVLEKAGAREIVSVGTPFDPSCHEAVAHVETAEHENNVIIEEFQKGYYLADRVLRPAMVSVAKRVN